METIQNLIGVLTAQRDLYKELYDLLLREKEYIINWDVDKMMELPKIKDTFFYKEKMLEEARRKVEQKISRSLGKDSITLSEILKVLVDDEKKETLRSISDEILEITEKIAIENKKIKILYNTNLKLISDFFNQIGITENKASYTRNYNASTAYKTAIDKNL
ncbi:flagellar protein FlgN [Deferribacter autotrophicus]|uniref:Flagellar protein FlgN n=1 Tax=Deferribacter autotrophicus TaxID=500465 RepID=A0A5A8F8M8_9BACT|nr:flagellar protein FlgN [Deferribacter autotrophicus]KAA0258762.1 flagellar protein FlgN [Deferribacter autotrophicus]